MMDFESIAYELEIVAKKKHELQQRGDTTSSEFLELLEKEIELKNDYISYIKGEKEETKLVRIKKSSKLQANEPEFRIKDWLPLPVGSVALISAPGGNGKTWTALQLALRCLEEDGNLKALLWLTEDPESSLRHRLDSILKRVMHLNDFTLLDRLDISTSAPVHLLQKDKGNFVISSKFSVMKNELKEYDLIVIDPLVAFFGGDENDNAQARLFMQAFLNWTKETNKTVVFLHHSKKGQSDEPRSRGAGAFVDASRVAYEMDFIYKKRDGKRTKDTEQLHKREFRLTKDNWGAYKYLQSFEFVRQITPITRELVPEVVEMPQVV